MFRFTLALCVLCAACAKKPTTPAGELIDQGTLVTTLDAKVTSCETFAIRKLDAHLVITANTAGADSFRYVLGGTPLALDRIRDDGQFLDDFEVELYCEGDKLIASGLRSNKLWNVREGREADLAAITSQE